MPKELTPKQVSNGLSYVQKEAPFLARMRGKAQEKEKQMRKFENYEDGQDDDDYDELEGAQVVELDDKGKEIHKDAGEKSDEEEVTEDSSTKELDDQPSIDENGRILFRKQAVSKKKESTNSKRKLQSMIDEEIKKTQDPLKKKKKNKKTAAPKVSLLSFQDYE